MRFRVVVLLAAGLLAVAFAGCGGGDDETATPDTVEGTVPADTSGDTTETGGDTGGATGGETTGGAGQGDAEAGASIFAEQGCGGCHTLEAAGSNGSIGPNLDETGPSFDKVVERVTEGAGAMPSFKDDLSEQQIGDVAAYVVASTQGG